MAAKTSRRPHRKREERAGRRVSKKPCYFCAEKIDYVDFKDVALLRKYLSDRAKIRSSRVTGTCGQHQRAVSRAIKNAREMALLPYLSR
ncbi:MAG: 30S ribosomal protein S18 [Actinobacteria bacterium]|jgi:small subunit ribosomal protein S18|nr:30S ribosomal protein S18 [Actinomycetota bacterium]MBU1492603.1 30S ribosomal protein S18 [Actinomycetota bacterium]MBU1865114.1 30S ribosomal protein S18 [Actinomycetota bacterium]